METNMDLHGTFSMVAPPIPWKLEIMVEPNMDPNQMTARYTGLNQRPWLFTKRRPAAQTKMAAPLRLKTQGNPKVNMSQTLTQKCPLFFLSLFTVRFSATNTEPNTYQKICHDLFLEVFWFQFFPHHRPGTWIIFNMWAQYEVKSRVARKSLTWNFQGERLKNH